MRTVYISIILQTCVFPDKTIFKYFLCIISRLLGQLPPAVQALTGVDLSGVKYSNQASFFVLLYGNWTLLFSGAEQDSWSPGEGGLRRRRKEGRRKEEKRIHCRYTLIELERNECTRSKKTSVFLLSHLRYYFEIEKKCPGLCNGKHVLNYKSLFPPPGESSCKEKSLEAPIFRHYYTYF